MSEVVHFPPKAKSAQDIEIEVEQAVLGSCFRRPDLLPEIMALCPPGEFFFTPHPIIAQAIHEAHQAGIPIKPLNIAARIADDKEFVDAGSRAYLEAMESMAPTDGALELAKGLLNTRMRREGIYAAQATADGLNRPGLGVLEALRPLLDMADHAMQALGRRDALPIRDAADAMLRTASDRASGRTAVAATTGLKLLDDAIGGLQGGDLVVLAGRPGMGKSALLMTTALRAAMEARPVIFFSLEMTQERLLQRIGCDLDFDQNPTSPLSYSWFRNGTAKHDDIARLGEALKILPDNLTIVENGSLDIHEMAAMARAFAARHRSMGVVVIDYLQKVSAGDRYRGNRVQEVTEISGLAKALAMQLKWPVVVGAQLNRGVENREEKRPNLTDLRESGSIEQDADAVIGLYRPAYYVEKRKPALGRADPAYFEWEAEFSAVKNQLHLFVLKNRNGAEDSLDVFCDMRASAIRNERPRGAK